MVAFAGFLLTVNRPGAISVNRPNVLATTFTAGEGSAIDRINEISAGTHTSNFPISLPGNNRTGYLIGQYGEIFYNRIHVNPFDVDFGNLISEQTRQIRVFNAFFTSVTLQNILSPGQEGISLSGSIPPPNVIYAPLQELTYTLRVTAVGPPEISANYLFDFTDPTPDATLTIRGSRIVVLPYIFRNDMAETLSWNTDVLTSYNGGEQRVRVRHNPRQSFTATAYIDPLNLTNVENLIYGWRKRTWAIPMWSELKIASPITDGDSTITVDTRFTSIALNSLVMVFENPRKSDVVEVQTFNDNSITFTRGVIGNFTRPFIVPILLGRMTSNPTRSTNGISGEISVSFEVTQTLTINSATPTNTFLTQDVFLDQPLLPNGLSENEYQHRIDLIDFDVGQTQHVGPWTYTRIGKTVLFEFADQEMLFNFKQWLSRREGRLRPFYMPSFENNITILSTGALGTSFTVRFDNISGQGFQRDHIAVRLTDGTWRFFTVSAVSLQQDGDEVMTLTDPLNLDRSEIDIVCYMGLKRLASDEITIQHDANFVSTSTLTVLEIEP